MITLIHADINPTFQGGDGCGCTYTVTCGTPSGDFDFGLVIETGSYLACVDECNHDSLCVRAIFDDSTPGGNCFLDEGELDIGVDVTLDKVHIIVKNQDSCTSLDSPSCFDV